jgi:site-specific DNA recombinase
MLAALGHQSALRGSCCSRAGSPPPMPGWSWSWMSWPVWGFAVRFTDTPDLAAGDPQATLLTQVQGVIAEYEKAKIAERYRRGKLFRARAGEVITWKTSYGYRRIARTSTTPAHLEIYEPEAAVVRRIFADRAAGVTVREICRRLNTDRIPSPTGKPTWGSSTVCRLPGNETYIGRAYFNRTETITDQRPGRRTRQVSRPREEWIPIGCPRIITDEHFEAAARVAYDNAKWSHRRAEPGEWLLKGLVRCGVCDVGTNCHKMRGRNGTWYRYYYCRNHDPLRADGEDRRCPERNIRADALDEFVFAQVRAALTLQRIRRRAGETTPTRPCQPRNPSKRQVPGWALGAGLLRNGSHLSPSQPQSVERGAGTRQQPPPSLARPTAQR